MSIELEVVVGQEDVSDDALEQAAGRAQGGPITQVWQHCLPA